MQFKSTRDINVSVSSAMAIKTGLSHDGGLFLPESIPQIDLATIEGLASMSYNERAKKILKFFLTDFTDEELTLYIDKHTKNQLFLEI